MGRCQTRQGFRDESRAPNRVRTVEAPDRKLLRWILQGMAIRYPLHDRQDDQGHAQNRGEKPTTVVGRADQIARQKVIPPQTPTNPLRSNAFRRVLTFSNQ